MGRTLSGSALKVIALICMIVDHTTKTAFAVWPWMRRVLFSVGSVKVTPAFIGASVIGRIAFPIFVFLCVEGVKHTRDIRKYMAGLLLFAVLSIVPFNLMRGVQWYDLHKMNVLFTLFLGVFGIHSLKSRSRVRAISAFPFLPCWGVRRPQSALRWLPFRYSCTTGSGDLFGDGRGSMPSMLSILCICFSCGCCSDEMALMGDSSRND